MTIEKTVRPYEVLVRFGRAGFQGAHVQDIEEVVEGDEVLAARILPARPLTEAEVGDVVGGEAARLIEAVEATRLQAQADAAAAAEARAALETLRAAREAADEAAWTARAELAVTAVQLERKVAEQVALEQALGEMAGKVRAAEQVSISLQDRLDRFMADRAREQAADAARIAELEALLEGVWGEGVGARAPG